MSRPILKYMGIVLQDVELTIWAEDSSKWCPPGLTVLVNRKLFNRKGVLGKLAGFYLWIRVYRSNIYNFDFPWVVVLDVGK